MLRAPRLAGLLLLTARAAAQQDPLFEVAGGATGAQVVAGLGDVDGDGFLEFAVGIPSGANPRVVIRRAVSGKILYELPGPPGVGRSLAGLGDVNGDALPDWVVAGSGPVTVYRGYDGHQIHSFLAPNATSGIEVARAGDVDADGFADVLIGYQHEHVAGVGSNAGAVYVYSGRTGALVHKVLGTQPDARFGSSLDGAGDVDGDGRDDFVVGAYREDGPTGAAGAGVVRLLSGADAAVLQLWSVPETYAGFGLSVAGLGDVDGDGRGDVAAGGPTYDGPQDYDVGVVRVLSGASGKLLHQFVGQADDEELSLVCSAGDFDGDGYGDLAYAGDPQAYRRVEVVSGRSGDSLVSLPGDVGFGSDLALLGDADGDGLDELLVGRAYGSLAPVYGYLGHRGLLGQRYCAPAVPNSTGLPAQILASGSALLDQRRFRASVQHAPAGRLGLLLASEKTGFLPGAGGGRGTLCLKAPVARFSASAAVSSAAGTFGWDVDLSAVPGFGQVLPGQTWHFQVWYRDDDPGPTSNLSDAASVLFH